MVLVVVLVLESDLISLLLTCVNHPKTPFSTSPGLFLYRMVGVRGAGIGITPCPFP